MKRLFLGALAALALSACASTNATLERHGAAAQLIVKVAAMKYIEQAGVSDRGARAVHIIQVVKAVGDVAGGEPITLQRLAQIATEQLPANLSPSDRMLAMALISVAQNELQARIGVGSLESDTLLKLNEVLAWISDAASLYAPTS